MPSVGHADPAAGFLDRRRSRRQSERHRRGRPIGHLAGGLHRRDALLRRDHLLGRGALHVGAPGQGQRRVGGAGRRVPRARSRRRTVPARAARHPRQAHRDCARHSGPATRTRARPRAGALRHAPSCSPTSTSSTLRCATTAAPCWPTTGWRDCGKRCDLRFPPFGPRHAAELRRARGGRRRAVGLGGRARAGSGSR